MSSLKLRTTATIYDIKPTKRTSYAAWWLKNSPKTWTQKQLLNQRKRQHKQSFSQDMGDLFRNISLHGYNKLLDPELTLFEKLIWLSLHVTSMITLCIVLSYTWERFVLQYLRISLYDPTFPIEKIPFPAISICSNNRISNRAALEYAQELRDKDPKKRDLEYYMNSIQLFSSLHYRNIHIDEYYGSILKEFEEFQLFLDKSENDTFFNSRKIMRRLAPNCSEFIVRCRLSGREIDCFSPVAFEDGLTTLGFCCTFNDKNMYRLRSTKNSFVSPDLGLTVILNNSQSDTFISYSNTETYNVFVHNSYDYPDTTSGSSQGVAPTKGEESYVSLKPLVVDTSELLHSYSAKTRKCYFDDEAPSKDLLVRNRYTFTNCITQCRINSIKALCNCIPYFMPLGLIKSTDGIVFCTLDHVNCLRKYSVKWHTVLNELITPPILRREQEESLFCPLCWPSCHDTQYRLSMVSLPLAQFRTTSVYKKLENEGLDVTNISVLHVHFGSNHCLYYRRIIQNEWYEVFSTVGNVLSIFLGFSLLAVFEVLYFLIKYLIIAGKHFIATNRKKEKQKLHINDDLEKFDRKLYICP